MRPDPASFKSWFCRMTFNVSLRLFDCSLARLNASWQAPHWLTWKLIISQKITRNEIAFLGRNWENVSLKSLVNWLLYQDLTPLIILNIIRPSRWDDKMYVGTPTSIDEQKRGVYYMLRNSRPRRTLQEHRTAVLCDHRLSLVQQAMERFVCRFYRVERVNHFLALTRT